MKPLYLFYFKTKETFWASHAAYIALEFEQYRQYLEGENIYTKVNLAKLLGILKFTEFGSWK